MPTRDDYPIYKNGESFPFQIAPAGLVRTAGPDAAAPGAFEVVNQNRALLNRFISQQRQAYALSGVVFQKQRMITPEADFEYRNHYGHEEVRVYPRVRQPGPAPTQSVPEVEPLPVEQPPIPQIPEPETQQSTLLVLYGTDKWAIFDITSIAAKGAKLITLGAAQASNWGTAQILSMQMPVKGTGIIYSQIALKANKVITHFGLFSTALIDIVETGANINSIPAWNTDGTTIFTPTASYEFVGGQFNQIDSVPLSPSDTYPYAIGPDGTCFYSPVWSGGGAAFQLGNEYTAGVNYNLPSALNTQLLNLQSTGGTGTATDVIYTAYWVEVEIERNKRDKVDTVSGQYYSLLGGPFNDIQTTVTFTQEISVQNTIIAAPIGTAGGTSVIGTGYAAKASFGGTATFSSGPSFAIGATVYTTYDASVNHATTKSAGGGNPDFSGTLEAPVFDVKNGLTIAQESVTASATDETSSTTPDPSTYTYYGGFKGNYSYNDTLNDEFNFNVLTCIWNLPPGVNAQQLIAPPYAGQGTASDASFYAKAASIVDATVAVLNAGELYGGQVSTQNFSAGPAGITFGNTSDWHTGASSNFGPTPYGGSTNPPVFGGISFGYSGNGQSGVLYLEDGVPYDYNVSTTVTTSASISALGESLSVSNGSAQILYHPFPPAFSPAGGSPIYYRQKVSALGAPTSTLTTPYETSDIPTAGFKPWCHIANQAHVLQGYTVAGQPKLYLDGSDFMPFLTKTLGCLPTDIKAVFMDIPYYAAVTLGGIHAPQVGGGGGI